LVPAKTAMAPTVPPALQVPVAPVARPASAPASAVCPE
jgi:hypothetical protein